MLNWIYSLLEQVTQRFTVQVAQHYAVQVTHGIDQKLLTDSNIPPDGLMKRNPNAPRPPPVKTLLVAKPYRPATVDKKDSPKVVKTNSPFVITDDDIKGALAKLKKTPSSNKVDLLI